jgi:fructose-1,6-bisphosphatase
MWLNKFKVAIAQRDPEAIARLLDTIPQFETVDEMRQAAFLCKEAEQIMQALKTETLHTRERLRRHIDFLKSARHDPSSELDITS